MILMDGKGRIIKVSDRTLKGTIRDFNKKVFEIFGVKADDIEG